MDFFVFSESLPLLFLVICTELVGVPFNMTLVLEGSCGSIGLAGSDRSASRSSTLVECKRFCSQKRDHVMVRLEAKPSPRLIKLDDKSPLFISFVLGKRAQVRLL